MDIVMKATHLHEECLLCKINAGECWRWGVPGKWQPPLADTVKINVDGCWFEHLGFDGVGW